MNPGLINLTRSVLKEIIASGNISDFISVCFSSLVSSIESQKNRENSNTINIILSQIYLKGDIKIKFLNEFNEIIKNGEFDRILLTNNSEIKFISDFLKDNFNFSVVDVEIHKSINTIFDYSSLLYQDFLKDNLSEKQWFLIIHSSHEQIKKQLNQIDQALKLQTTEISDINTQIGSINDQRKIAEIWSKYMEHEKKKFNFSDYEIPLKKLFVKPLFEYEDRTDINFPKTMQISSTALGTKIFTGITNKIYFISGDPGVGKSSQLISWISNRQFQNELFSIIPLNRVTIELKSVNDIISIIKLNLSHFSSINLDETSFYDLINGSNKLTLFVDGLDEYNPKKYDVLSKLKTVKIILKNFIDTFSSMLIINVVIVGRPIAIQSINHKLDNTYTLLPLTSSSSRYDKRKELIENFNLGEDFGIMNFCLCEYNDYQYEVTRYPMLLSRFLFEYKSGNKEVLNSRNKYDFYYRMFNYHFSRDEDKLINIQNFNLIWFFSKVGHISWILGNVRIINLEELAKDNALAKMLDNIQESNRRDLFPSYFVRSYFVNSVKGSDFFEYHHKTFGEYFVSYYFIKEVLNIFSIKRTFSEYLVMTYKLLAYRSISRDLKSWLNDGFELHKKEDIVLNNFIQYIYDLLVYRFYENEEKIYSVLFNVPALDKDKFSEKLKNLISNIAVIFNILDNECWSQRINKKNKTKGIYKKMILDLKFKKEYLETISQLNLSNSQLSGVSIENFSLININLEKSNLKGSYLINLKFTGANLKNVDLTHCDLAKSNFDSSDMENAILKNTLINKASFIRASMINAIIEELNFTGCKMKAVDLSGAKATGSNFSYTKLESSKFAGTLCSNCNFQYADMRFVNFQNAILKDSKFQNADLRQSDFLNANLENSNFEKANLKDSNLSAKQIISLSSISAAIDLDILIIQEVLDYDALKPRLRKELEEMKLKKSR